MTKLVEPTNIKMARLRESVTGTLFEAIRSQGVSDQEYEETKENLQNNLNLVVSKETYMDPIEEDASLEEQK